MAFDAHKNLAIADIVTAPSPAASGTSLTVGAGMGARFPAVPFNATVWPVDMAPDPTTAEVVRVTARTTDTLTIVRAQEGTTARAIIVGDFVAATITAKSLTDIESGVNFPLITTAGNIVASGGVTGGYIVSNTNAFFTQKYALTSATGVNGQLMLTNAAQDDFSLLQFGGATSAFPALKRSGAGLAVRAADDSGLADLSTRNILIGTAASPALIHPPTNDGADSSALYLCGGGDTVAARGASIGLCGNEYAAPGFCDIKAGNHAVSAIRFYTGADQQRGQIHPSGGFSWGGSTDPGAGVFLVGTYGGASAFLSPTGYIQSGMSGTAVTHMGFYNNAGGVGSITSSGATTAFNTTSDARLKTPLSRHTDTEVLRHTVIHDFLWKSDGTVGRGVFAQEAHEVAPFAVSVGSDEVDAEGRFTKPWGVDYSKYVPDLITGWQDHDHELDKLRADVAVLTETIRFTAGAVDALRKLSSVINRMRTVIRAFVSAWKPSWV